MRFLAPLAGFLFTPVLAHSTSVISFESALQQPIDNRVRIFREHQPASLSFLRQLAFDRKESLTSRWRAITTMGRWDAGLFRQEIDRALASPEWFLRNAALIALLSDAHQRALSWSMRLLNDPALVVRTQAVRNIIALDGREAEPLLWKAIKDPRNFKGKESLWIRAHMAEALAGFAQPGRVKDFRELLLDPDERLHLWAMRGLETATGIQLGNAKTDPMEVRRAAWLARLGVEEI